MRIYQNVAALNAWRNLTNNTDNLTKSLERLSSGLRINKSADDAAGLAISEKMRGQISGLHQAQRNAQNGISLIQTTESALNETHAILQSMRKLASDASSDTNTPDDRIEIQKMIDELTSEINRIGNTTEFNTMKMLNGDFANTLKVDGVNYSGGGKSETAAALGLTVDLDTTNALAAGKYTLETTSTRNTRDAQSVAPKASDFDGTSTGIGKVNFADNNIKVAAAGNNDEVEDDWTLTYDDARNGFKLTNDAGTVDDWIEFNEEYDEHGLTFTIEEEGHTLADGQTLKFTVGAGRNDVGTKEDGWTSGAVKKTTFDTDITFNDINGDGASWAGGSVEIVFDGGNTQVTVTIKDKDGTVVANDKNFEIVNGGEYDHHGLSFTIDTWDDTEDGTIKFTIADDTFKVTAELKDGDGDQVGSVVLTDSYDGAANNTIVDETGIAGLTLNSSATLKADSFDFEVVNDITGTDNSLAFQIGANENQTLRVSINDMRAQTLGISSTAAGNGFGADKSVTDGTNSMGVEYSLDMSSNQSAAAAITIIDSASAKVSGERSKLGATQNRLEHTIKNLGAAEENLTLAESRIRGIDIAEEMSNFTKQQILLQASTAMMAHANSVPQMVLQLLG